MEDQNWGRRSRGRRRIDKGQSSAGRTRSSSRRLILTVVLERMSANWRSREDLNGLAQRRVLVSKWPQGRRLGRCGKSAAIWGAPVVMPTWARRRHLAHSFHRRQPATEAKLPLTAQPGACRPIDAAARSAHHRLRSPSGSFGDQHRVTLPASVVADFFLR
jgi:hypothetical protein